jgi:hypothetical protein
MKLKLNLKNQQETPTMSCVRWNKKRRKLTLIFHSPSNSVTKPIGLYRQTLVKEKGRLKKKKEAVPLQSQTCPVRRGSPKVLETGQ